MLYIYWLTLLWFRFLLCSFNFFTGQLQLVSITDLVIQSYTCNHSLHSGNLKTNCDVHSTCRLLFMWCGFSHQLRWGRLDWWQWVRLGGSGMWRTSWDEWTPAERSRTHQSLDHQLPAQSAFKQEHTQSEDTHHTQSMWPAWRRILCFTLSQHPGLSGWSTRETYEWSLQTPDSEPEQRTHCRDERKGKKDQIPLYIKFPWVSTAASSCFKVIFILTSVYRRSSSFMNLGRETCKENLVAAVCVSTLMSALLQLVSCLLFEGGVSGIRLTNKV